MNAGRLLVALSFAVVTVSAQTDPTGSWRAVFVGPMGDRPKMVGAMTFTIQSTPTGLTGTARAAEWPGDLEVSEVKLDGDRLSFVGIGKRGYSTRMPGGPLEHYCCPKSHLRRNDSGRRDEARVDLDVNAPFDRSERQVAPDGSETGVEIIDRAKATGPGRPKAKGPRPKKSSRSAGPRSTEPDQLKGQKLFRSCPLIFPSGLGPWAFALGLCCGLRPDESLLPVLALAALVKVFHRRHTVDDVENLGWNRERDRAVLPVPLTCIVFSIASIRLS